MTENGPRMVVNIGIEATGALGEQASCLLCLLIHRCQTDFKQISVLHLSDICGQTGGDGALGEQEVVFFIIGT